MLFQAKIWSEMQKGFSSNETKWKRSFEWKLQQPQFFAKAFKTLKFSAADCQLAEGSSLAPDWAIDACYSTRQWSIDWFYFYLSALTPVYLGSAGSQLFSYYNGDADSNDVRAGIEHGLFCYESNCFNHQNVIRHASILDFIIVFAKYCDGQNLLRRQYNNYLAEMIPLL